MYVGVNFFVFCALGVIMSMVEVGVGNNGALVRETGLEGLEKGLKWDPWLLANSYILANAKAFHTVIGWNIRTII